MHDVEGDNHVLAIWSDARLTVFKVRDKLAFYSENGIRVEIWIAIFEDVSSELFMSRCLDHKVNMRRAHRATVRCVKQLSYRSVLWDRIGCRPDGPEKILSFLVGVEVTATIDLRGLLLLHIVETILIGLPDFDECVWNRLACGRQHSTMHETRLTSGSIRYVVSVFKEGRVLHEKGAKERSKVDSTA